MSDMQFPPSEPTQQPPDSATPEKPKKKHRFLKFAGIGAAAIVGITLMVNGLGNGAADAERPASDQTTTQTPRPDRPAEKPDASPAPEYDLAVKAGTLIRAFERNELAADQTYADKTLKVTGVVDKIDTDIFNEDEYVLNLTDGSEYAILSVSVHGIPQRELSTIEVGQTVTVIADFDDGGDLGVTLKNGRLA